MHIKKCKPCLIPGGTGLAWAAPYLIMSDALLIENSVSVKLLGPWLLPDHP